MQDILRGVEHVEIRVRGDGAVVWVNINGVCALRAYTKDANVVVVDERPQYDVSMLEIRERGV